MHLVPIRAGGATPSSPERIPHQPAEKRPGYYDKCVQKEHRVTPHVAQKVHSAIDRRSTRHPGYRLSQWRRKRVEEIFGWLKTVAGLRKTRHRGIARVGWTFTFAAAAYNLVRMRNLPPVAT